jgi:hypothetical protein
LCDEFLAEHQLIEDWLSPFRREMEWVRSRSEFEQRVFAWCIQQYVPLCQLTKDEAHLVFYESFAAKPREEIERLFVFLGKKYDESVLEAYNKPSQAIMMSSQVGRKQAAILTGKSLTESWRDDISKEQTRQAIEILRIFGLDIIYGEDSLPNPDGVAKFRNQKRRVAVRESVSTRA